MCTWIVMLCSVTQSWLTLYNPMHCSPLGTSVHGIFQARILEWVVISCSRIVVLWCTIYSSAIRYTRWSQYKNLYNLLKPTWPEGAVRVTGVVGTQWSSKAGRRANYFGKEQRICWQLILGNKGEISFYTPPPTGMSLVCELNPPSVLSRSVLSDSLWPHGLYPTRLLCSWDSSGKNTRVGCHFLLKGIFPP